MIVVTNTDGQFCNRILLFAHIAAVGMKYGVKTIFPFMDNILDVLESSDFVKSKYNIKIYRFKRYKLHVVILRKLFKNNEKILKLIDKIFNCKKYFDKRKLRKNGIVFVNTWYCRNYDALFEYKDEVLKLLKFKKETIEEAKKFFELTNKDADDTINVALHIRRGDYRTYREGKYFYTDEEYANIMRCLKDNTTKHICFYLFSNEEISTEYYVKAGFDVVDVYKCSGKIEFDLALMSMCDYIMGVPSTFSWWAAFYGDKPYLTLKNKDDSFTLEDFAKVEGEEFNSDYTLQELKNNYFA